MPPPSSRGPEPPRSDGSRCGQEQPPASCSESSHAGREPPRAPERGPGVTPSPCSPLAPHGGPGLSPGTSSPSLHGEKCTRPRGRGASPESPGCWHHQGSCAPVASLGQLSPSSSSSSEDEDAIGLGHIPREQGTLLGDGCVFGGSFPPALETEAAVFHLGSFPLAQAAGSWRGLVGEGNPCLLRSGLRARPGTAGHGSSAPPRASRAGRGGGTQGQGAGRAEGG